MASNKWEASKSKYSFDLNTDPMIWDGSTTTSNFDTDYYTAVRTGFNEPTARKMTAEAKSKATAEARSKYGYDPNDLSEAGVKKSQEAWSKAYADYEVATGPKLNQNTFYSGAWDAQAAYNALVRDTVWSDYAMATRQFYNAQSSGALAEIETGKLQRKQFEQMRKIATEGNEEASEDQRPTGKASVLIGSNIPDRKQKRTSYSRDAGTAKAKVKVQAKGINI